MGRHQRGPQQRAARRDRRVDRDVGVDAGVEERLPQQRGLLVLADDDRDDRRGRLAAVRERPGLDHLQPEVAEALAQVARRCRAACAISSGPSVRITRSAASAAPTAAGTAEAVKMKAREAKRRYSITSAGPGDEAAAGGEALREGPHPQVDARPRGRRARRRRRRARRARRRACASSTISRAPWLAAELDDRRQVAEVALHREDAVDDDEHAAAVAGGPLEHLLELRHLVVAEGAQLGARELAAVEDRGVVGRVADHRVAGPEDRPDRARRSPGGRW